MSNHEKYGYVFGRNAASLYRNSDGKELLPKSRNYREPLAPYLGMRITAIVPTYDIEKSEREELWLCMHHFTVSVLDTGLDVLADREFIDHMHISIPKRMKRIKKRKPLNITGYLYEYEKYDKEFGRIVRNIGIWPIYVSQSVWLYTQGQPLGAVPRFWFMLLMTQL